MESQNASSLDVELVGVRFDPLGGMAGNWLPLRAGLNVLYGLNGAGKTTILNSLQGGLRDDELGQLGMGRTFFFRVPHPLSDAFASLSSTIRPHIKALCTHPESYGLGTATEPIYAQNVEMTEQLAQASIELDDVVALFKMVHPHERSEVFSPEYIVSQFHARTGRSQKIRTTLSLEHEEDYDQWRLASALIDIEPVIFYAHLLTDDDGWTAGLAAMPESAGDLISGHMERAHRWRRATNALHKLDPDGDDWFDLSEECDSIRKEGPWLAQDIEARLGDCVSTSKTKDYCPFVEAVALTTFVYPPINLATGIDGDFKFAGPFGLNSATLERLSSANPEPVTLSDGSLHFEKSYDDPRPISEAASRILASLMTNPPTLHFETSRFPSFEQPLEWFASIREAPTVRVRLRELSHTQQKWARLSISEAFDTYRASKATSKATVFSKPRSIPPRILLLDEPEAGSHRSGETHLAAGLLELSARQNTTVVVGTHCPALLDIPTANLTHVSRNMMGTRVANLPEITRQNIAEFGMRPSDLLARIRVFLLVEGEHEMQILQHWIGPRLKLLNAELLPMRGAKNYALAVESKVFSEFSDARVVATMDSMRTDVVRRAWLDAKSANAAHGIGDAESVLSSGLKDGGIEEKKFLKDFLVNALRCGLESRVVLCGMNQPDVIMYLDSEMFVPGRDWEGLYADFQAAQRSPNTPNNFKRWLEIRHKIEITHSLIEKASVELGSKALPEDVAALIDACL